MSSKLRIPVRVTYTVTFDGNGGSETPSATVYEGEKVTRPADPTLPGFTFNSWHLNHEVFDFNTPITEDITLLAIWDEDHDYCTVSFDTDGGSEIEDQLVERGELATKPDDPVKEGYVVSRWTKKVDGEFVTFDFETEPITEDIKLFVEWDIDD